MAVASALIIAVPEAEPLVNTLRDQFDRSAAQGVPAHITILYPFLPPQALTPIELANLRALFASIPAFEFSLIETRHFPGVLYLAPSPAECFKALTHAVVERYPEYQPYGGAYTEVIPHLTIADRLEPAQLADMEREFTRQHRAQLPVKVKAHAVTLIENSSGRWETLEKFPLKEDRDE